MPAGAGRVQCCLSSHPCSNFVHDPIEQCFSVGAWCHCQACPPCVATCSTFNPSFTTSPDGPLRHPHLGAQISSKKSRHSAPAKRLIESLFFRCGENHFSKKDSDPFLKRVHSDPVKVRAYCELLRGDRGVLHSHLVQSHSLDGHSKAPPPRLRLRTSSSRLISHHSSSSEEWFEEVPPSSDEEKEKKEDGVEERPASPISHPQHERASFGSDSASLLARDGILLPPRPCAQDLNSLNNLLLSDSCSARSAAFSSDFPDPSSNVVFSPDNSTNSGSSSSKVLEGVTSASGKDSLPRATYGQSGFVCVKETRDATVCCCAVS